MSPTFQYLAENIGLIGAVAVALNFVLISALIWLGKAFARGALAEIKEIKQLLADETRVIRDRLTDHGERLARLEAHSDRDYRS